MDPIVKEDGSWHFRPNNNNLSKAEQIAFKKRKLLASPYNAQFWADLAIKQTVALEAPGTDLESFYAGDSAMINAIVYSMHDPRWLQQFGREKWTQYERLTDPGARPLPRKVAHFADRENLDRHVVCPMIRTKILYDLVVEMLEQENRLFSSPIMRIAYDDLLAQVESEQRCSHVLGADIEDLAFEPVDLDLASEGL